MRASLQVPTSLHRIGGLTNVADNYASPSSGDIVRQSFRTLPFHVNARSTACSLRTYELSHSPGHDHLFLLDEGNISYVYLILRDTCHTKQFPLVCSCSQVHMVIRQPMCQYVERNDLPEATRMRIKYERHHLDLSIYRTSRPGIRTPYVTLTLKSALGGFV
jgi:hypothetical protein